MTAAENHKQFIFLHTADYHLCPTECISIAPHFTSKKFPESRVCGQGEREGVASGGQRKYLVSVCELHDVMGISYLEPHFILIASLFRGRKHCINETLSKLFKIKLRLISLQSWEMQGSWMRKSKKFHSLEYIESGLPSLSYHYIIWHLVLWESAEGGRWVDSYSTISFICGITE